MFFFVVFLKPVEHTILPFMGAFLKEYLVIIIISKSLMGGTGNSKKLFR